MAFKVPKPEPGIFICIYYIIILYLHCEKINNNPLKSKKP